MTSDLDWPDSLTRIQGELIAHHRELRGYRHQDLVDRLSELGVEMKRTTLVNIEQGRRKSISVPEIYAFAYALEVPPILLLVPLGNVETVEMLKGKPVSPWVATRWVRGDGVLDAPIDGRIPSEGPLRDQFKAVLLHGEILMWHRFLDDLQHEILALGQRNEDGSNREKLELKQWEVQSWRNRIRESGLVPPPIWPEVSALYPEMT